MKQLTCLLITLFALVAIQTQFVSADEWHQWRGTDRKGVWNETGILEEFEGEQIHYVGASLSAVGIAGRALLMDACTSQIDSQSRNKLNVCTVLIG